MRVHVHVYIVLAMCFVVCVLSRQPPTETFEDDQVQAAVVGGRDEAKRRYPWFTSLLRRGASGRLEVGCGGMLIAPDVVLTAAHCTMGGVEYVSIGITDKGNLLDGAEVRRVVGVMAHPKFSMVKGESGHDIAVLLLGLRSTHYPVRLPRSGVAIPSKLTLLGFGVNRPIDLENATPEEKSQAIANLPTRLQEGLLDVRPCTTVPNRGPFICAGGRISGCVGDSGGPLFMKGKHPREDVVFGITSFGTQCGMKLPAVYTSITAHYAWIVSAIRQLRAR